MSPSSWCRCSPAGLAGFNASALFEELESIRNASSVLFEELESIRNANESSSLIRRDAMGCSQFFWAVALTVAACQICSL